MPSRTFFYLLVSFIGRPAARRPWHLHIEHSHAAMTRGKRETMYLSILSQESHTLFSGDPWQSSEQNGTELGGKSAPNPVATHQVSPGCGAGISFPEDPSVHRILALERKRGKQMLGRKVLCLPYGVPLELGVVRLECQPLCA